VSLRAISAFTYFYWYTVGGEGYQQNSWLTEWQYRQKGAGSLFDEERDWPGGYASSRACRLSAGKLLCSEVGTLWEQHRDGTGGC